jgi:7,8-dihydropterin-6-yl-methyl-4-(beta-D-ribofuranosyl)aminobenzene 5'-phosphate synthase
VCKESATADDVRAAMPHPVVGSAADPIALEPVDDVVVTTLVDNVYDALLTGDDSITRAPLAAGTAQAPQFELGFTNVGLMAEHGFSALVAIGLSAWRRCVPGAAAASRGGLPGGAADVPRWRAGGSIGRR